MTRPSARFLCSCLVLAGLTLVASAQEGRFVDVRPVPGLPGTGSSVDTGPSVTEDEKTIVFTSSRCCGEGDRDLFMAERSSPGEPFGPPFPLGTPVNTAGWEHNAHISPSGLKLYYASLGDLYAGSRATREDRFTSRTSLGPCVNTPGIFDSGPSVTRDGLELFFFSNRSGGMGGFDIWQARRSTVEDAFCEVRNVSEVNTGGDELHCAISADGLALIFDSRSRSPANGENDIWIARRETRHDFSPFSTPVNINDFGLGSEVNGALVDYTASLSPAWPQHGSKLYFSRALPGFTNQQLYEATWITDPPEAELLVDPDSPVVSHEATFDGTGSYSRGGHSIVSYEWDFGDGNTAEGGVARHAYATPGRYLVQLTVTDENGRSDASAMSINVVCENTDLRLWSRADIGAPLYPGSTHTSGEGGSACLTMCAGGRDLSRSVDECHFVYQEGSGDVALTVHIAELEGRSRSKGGIMLRQSLETHARSVALLVEDKDVDRLLLQKRDGDEFSQVTVGDVSATGAWLRLARRGEEVIASSSTDGVAWIDMDPVRLELPRDILAGGAATGRDFNATPFLPVTVQFCDLGVRDLAVRFHRGDPNLSGTTDICDSVGIFGYLFLGDPATLSCAESADANNDGEIDISDGIFLLSWLFLGGLEPPAPGPPDGPCGVDTDPPGSRGDLGCLEYSKCP